MELREVKVGDVVLIQSKLWYNMISKAIRLIQGNKYSHVAIVVSTSDNPDLMLVAEIDSGIKSRITTLREAARNSEYVFARHYNARIVDHELFGLAAQSKGKFTYYYAKIFDALVNHGIGVFRRNWTYQSYLASKKCQDRFICSTYVSWLLSDPTVAGLPYNGMAEPDDYTKGDWKVLG